MNVNNMIADPDNWDKIAPSLGDYPLRPYNVLAADPYYAQPGFYWNDEVLAFQPGWDGIDGGDAVYWYDPPWPTVARVREALKRQSLTAVWEPEGITVRRKDRTVVIHGDEPMASILLRGGKYGEAGRTVAGVDYGVMRDEDVIAPAVSFLRFEV